MLVFLAIFTFSWGCLSALRALRAFRASLTFWRRHGFNFRKNSKKIDLLGDAFQVKTLVSSAVEYDDVRWVSLAVRGRPGVQVGLRGGRGRQVNTQPLAGPLNGLWSMWLFGKAEVAFDLLWSPHSQLMFVIVGRRPQADERWGSTAIRRTRTPLQKKRSMTHPSRLSIKGNQTVSSKPAAKSPILRTKRSRSKY